ncbi:tetratricopeptide repeat protein [Sulfurimonas sp. SAG-AH-194-C21]|nr:tetratricopeptide repeat protein [Sulfurimonas sp. SAG-AH-194-C21]MDF1883746.1 tetratricopeptide repeat protein [Sulfurimonas sp. SAG-AH-194-C21]
MSQKVQEFIQLGTKALQENNLRDAQYNFSQAVMLNPSDTKALFCLGIVCQKDNNITDAQALFLEVLKINPKYVEAYSMLAHIYFNEGEIVAAKECYEYALKIDTSNAELYNNLGSSHQELNELQEAKTSYKKAIELLPGYISVLYNLSYVYLKEGNYQEGFNLYRYRYTKEIRGESLGGVAYPPTLLTPEINIQDKVIYISHEQGLGDTIQFIRYLPFFTKKAKKVLCYVPESLQKLFALNYPDVEFINPNSTITFDYNFPMLEAPYLLGTLYDTVPFKNQYLKIQDKDLANVQKYFKKKSSRLKVGINYKGSQGEKAAKGRSLELKVLLKSLTPFLDSYDFYSLQYEYTPEEENLLQEYGLTNLGKEIHSFYDTALFIESMDIVISVDTSLLNLAGAMGKKTFALLKFCPDWRWGVEAQTNNWYSSIYGIKQDQIHQWDHVLTTLANKLQKIKDEIL